MGYRPAMDTWAAVWFGILAVGVPVVDMPVVDMPGWAVRIAMLPDTANTVVPVVGVVGMAVVIVALAAADRPEVVTPPLSSMRGSR
ncbi:hypothetical protein EP30_06820 [Bifidobacterium sp. UTCIF-39]|nr:hypothetical protein EP30_06820 [Bifidobacterium sp. UTCIF-39]